MKIVILIVGSLLLAGCAQANGSATVHVPDEAIKACHASVMALVDRAAPIEEYAQAAVIVAFGCQKDAETEPTIFQERYGN